MTHEQPNHRCGPIAVLTGASSGIGASLAGRLDWRGYRLVLIARRGEAIRTVAEATGHPDRHIALPLDLCDPEAPRAIAEAVEREGEPAQLIINCAGGGQYRRFLDSSSDAFASMWRLNYLAPAEIIRLLLPGMIEAEQGHIINIASMSTKVGPWGHSAYAPPKAALVSLTQALAGEYRRHSVRFSYVNPGIVDTPYFHQPGTQGLWPRVRRHAIPVDRVASAIERLIDRPRLELCVPRSYRLLDWIIAVSPSLAHRIVTAQSRDLSEIAAAPTKPKRKPRPALSAGSRPRA